MPRPCFRCILAPFDPAEVLYLTVLYQTKIIFGIDENIIFISDLDLLDSDLLMSWVSKIQFKYARTLHKLANQY